MAFTPPPGLGPFTFPGYGTQGIRLTSASNAPAGCDPRLYSYWSCVSNHRGHGHLSVVIGRRGGQAPILLRVDKASGTVTTERDLPMIGTGEGCYSSDTHPTRFYFLEHASLRWIDVGNWLVGTVFTLDAKHGHHLWQAHSSSDDQVHSATVKDATDQNIGAVVFINGAQRFFPEPSGLDEVQIDKSGRWLVMQIDAYNRILDLQAGGTRVIRNEQGALSHLDCGDGFMVGEDDSGSHWMLTHWNVRDLTKRMIVVGSDPWGSGAGHVAVRGHVALHSRNDTGELVRVGLADGTQHRIAPGMIDGHDYDHQLRACLDPTGSYAAWIAKVEGRFDAFLVRLPGAPIIVTTPDPKPEAMNTRTVSLTVSPHTAAGSLRIDSGQTFSASTTTGRLQWVIDQAITGGASLSVSAVGYHTHTGRAVLPPGSTELAWEQDGVLVTVPLDLVPAQPARLRVEGDHFMLGTEPWIWKGSTEFRLPERVLAGVDIRPILQDRRDAGANLVRMLAQKADNTGYSLSSHTPGYWNAVIRTCELVGEAGLYGEWTVFADTKKMMPNPVEQQDFYAQTVETIRKFPHMVLELVNEDKHATQSINAQAFRRPDGLLSSHGSGLTDAQPVKPLWDYATYHARRTPAPPNAKPFNNLSGYEFHPEWPHPVPYVCEESVKPEDYGYNAAYARQMGLAARLGPGATFHGSWWLEERLFNDDERSCARAFFRALSGDTTA